MQKSKLLLFASFFYFDLSQFLSLDYLKSQQSALENFVQEEPLLSSVVYFVIYVLVTAISLPGATIMTLAGGGPCLDSYGD